MVAGRPRDRRRTPRGAAVRPRSSSIDRATGAVRAPSRRLRDGRHVSPFWLPDGTTILFASDRGGKPFAIYSVDVATGRTRRLERHRRRRAVAGRCRRTAASSSSSATAPTATICFRCRWMRPRGPTSHRQHRADCGHAVRGRAVRGRAKAGGGEPDPPSTPYRPWRTLAPRYWTPIVESDSGEIVAGAGDIGGRRARPPCLRRRRRLVGVTARPDWSFAYAYDRWWPTLFASDSDDTDPLRDGAVRTRELNAGARVPCPPRAVGTGRCSPASADPPTRSTAPSCEPASTTRGEAPLAPRRLGFDNARIVRLLDQRRKGRRCRVTSEITRRGLGADGERGADDATRGLPRAFPRHSVLAARVAGATSWGDRPVPPRCSPPAAPARRPRASTSAATRSGCCAASTRTTSPATHAVVANLDYRFPLARIQRGVGTLPFFLRTAHAAVFADAGHAWNGRFRLVRSPHRLRRRAVARRRRRLLRAADLHGRRRLARRSGDGTQRVRGVRPHRPRVLTAPPTRAAEPGVARVPSARRPEMLPRPPLT